MTPLDNSPDPIWVHPDDNGGTSDLRGPRGYDTGYVVEDHGTARVGRLTLAPDPPVVSRLAPERDRVLKLRFIKRPGDQRIVKVEVFDADTCEVVGQIFVSDVKLSYPANGGHPEALVRLISAWEDAYE